MKSLLLLIIKILFFSIVLRSLPGPLRVIVALGIMIILTFTLDMVNIFAFNLILITNIISTVLILLSL